MAQPGQPKATKGKKDKVIHPNSRAAMQLARQTFRSEHTEKRQKERSIKLETLGKKLLWFQERLEADKKVYIKDELHELASRYMDRFSDELEQIDIVNSMKGRTGFQHQARKDAIRNTQEQERNEFTSQGLEVPDLLNGKVVQYLREWNGELRYVQNIKLIRIKDNEGKKSSSKNKNNLQPADNTSSDINVKCVDGQECSNKNNTDSKVRVINEGNSMQTD